MYGGTWLGQTFWLPTALQLDSFTPFSRGEVCMITRFCMSFRGDAGQDESFRPLETLIARLLAAPSQESSHSREIGNLLCTRPTMAPRFRGDEDADDSYSLGTQQTYDHSKYQPEQVFHTISLQGRV